MESKMMGDSRDHAHGASVKVLTELLANRKPCSICGVEMIKPRNFTRTRWAGNRFCSQVCHGRSRAGVASEPAGDALLRRTARVATGCLEWTGPVNKHGYGKITHGGRGQFTHRLAYQTWVGEIPPRELVCHRCDNRRCIEPQHLFLGSNAENTEDRQRKGRQARGESAGRAKLTEADVRAIRASAARHADLAAQYAVGETAISNIKARRSWAHVA